MVVELPPRRESLGSVFECDACRSPCLLSFEAHELSKSTLRFGYIGKLNTLWSKAGIYFGLETIVREPAAQTDRFRQLVERKNGKLGVLDYFTLLLKPGRGFDGFHAFFFHDLPMNGASVVEDIVIVTEQARLKPVEGGIDEPIPRVLGFSPIAVPTLPD